MQKKVKGRKYYCMFRRWVARVVIDEGHICRNPDTLFAETLVQTKSHNVHFLTATPLLNHPRDLLGYLHQVWRREPTQEWDLNVSKPYLEMYKDDFDPEHVVYDPDDPTEEPASVMPQKNERTRELWDAHQAGIPLYVLSPHNYHLAGKEAAWSPERCQEIMPRIIKTILLRVGYETSIDLGNGKEARVADEVKPAKVYAVQLEMADDEQEKWDRRCLELVKKINSGPDQKIAHRNATTDAAGQDYGKKGQKEEGQGQINEGLLRFVKVMAVDPRLEHLMSLNHKDMDDAQKEAAVRQRAQRFIDLKAKEDKGASMFFVTSRDGPQYRVPEHRLDMARYAAHMSTKARYCLSEIALRMEKNEKSVLVFEYPLTRW